MIYYPLSALMLAGLRDILIISTPQDTPRFRDLLGDGSQWGLNLQYAVQPSPDGLAQAFIIGRDFIGDDHAALVLGDNVFLRPRIAATAGACPYPAKRRHGIRLPGQRSRALRCGRIRRRRASDQPGRKAEAAKSRHAVTGIYFYDNSVVERAARPQALGPRRAGNYRPQPPVPRRRHAERRDHGARHGVAGYWHP